MATLNVSRVDLESGLHHRSGGATSGEEEEEGSVCFSDAEEGSCYSQFYSTADGDGSVYDEYAFACDSGSRPSSRKASSVADESSDESDDNFSVDIESGETKAHLDRVERDCRICHLSLESNGGGNESTGVAIELGCSCKDDLAAAHKHCAEAWFKIRGNKICEICNSIARNVVGVNDFESVQPTNENNAVATQSASVATAPTTETRSCINGHRFLNFLLACMVFAFVISWLFHFNIPS